MRFRLRNFLQALLLGLLVFPIIGPNADAKNKATKKLHVRLQLNLSKKNERGQDYPVCLELEKVLNLPENLKSFAQVGDVRHDIIFPKQSTNFESVKWQPIALEEAKSYFPAGYLDQILTSDKNQAITLNHDWKPDSKFEFEKTTVDYDAHPPAETFIRYRYSPLSHGVCLITQSAPNPARSNFNGEFIGSRYGHSLGSDGCELFSYGGRIYLYGAFSNINPYVIRPESEGYQDPAPSWAGKWSGPYWYVNHRQLCSFRVER